MRETLDTRYDDLKSDRLSNALKQREDESPDSISNRPGEFRNAASGVRLDIDGKRQ